MEYRTITTEKTGNKGVIMLDRPERLNAISLEMLIELQAAVDDMNRDDDIRAVIIGAKGEKVFSAGGDIKEEALMTPVDAKNRSERAHRLLKSIENSRKPYIAAIYGFTIGAGCEMSLACDFRIAADDTSIAVPAVKLGIINGFGANVRLPRMIGKTLAKEMLMTGRSMDAEEAYRLGLLNRVVPRGQLLEEAHKFADELVDKSSAVLALIKEAVDTGADFTVHQAIAKETALFAKSFALEDKDEGMNAFLSKRTPVFSGR